MNLTSPNGAMDLSRRITEFWEKRGLTVRCAAVKIRLSDDDKVIPSNLWAIRSNLRFDKNGNAYTVDED